MLEKHQAPVTLRNRTVQGAGRNPLRVRQAVFEASRKLARHAVDFFARGWIFDDVVQRLVNGVARGVQRLILIQRCGNDDEARVVLQLESHAGRLGELGVDERFREPAFLAASSAAASSPAATAAIHDAGQHLKDRGIGMASRHRVIGNHDVLPLPDTPE